MHIIPSAAIALHICMALYSIGPNLKDLQISHKRMCHPTKEIQVDLEVIDQCNILPISEPLTKIIKF